jgi:signal transduction histidine kinase
MLTWNDDSSPTAAPPHMRGIARRGVAPTVVSRYADLTAAILRAIPDLIFLLRRDGTYVDYHARNMKLLFVPPEQFLGRTIRDVLPSDVADRLSDAIDRATDGGDPIKVEFELCMPESHIFEARVVSAGGDLVLSVVREVTDARRAEALNRDLAGRLIAAQEEERAHIARDLHDGMCQELASVTVDLSYLRMRGGDIASPEVQSMLTAIQRRTAAIAESMRLLSHDLHPSGLQYLGLVSALQAHCSEAERHHKMRVGFFSSGEVEPADPQTALSLYRIAQEALQNAATHGRARHADVALVRDASLLVLTVTDNGSGFDVATARRRGGLGLVSIEERARLSRGEATFRSRPGQTIVKVSVPIQLDLDHAPPKNPAR